MEVLVLVLVLRVKTQSLGFGLGLDKKVLFTSLILIGSAYPRQRCCKCDPVEAGEQSAWNSQADMQIDIC